jgi:hypothetical protein
LEESLGLVFCGRDSEGSHSFQEGSFHCISDLGWCLGVVWFGSVIVGGDLKVVLQHDLLERAFIRGVDEELGSLGADEWNIVERRQLDMQLEQLRLDVAQLLAGQPADVYTSQSMLGLDRAGRDWGGAAAV